MSAQGEFLTLLGPSGSGKTTTLNMLAGFERPTRGEILLGGKPVDRLPPYERNIGMVFQNYALFPHMTVGENVAFPLSVRRVARGEIAERVQRALCDGAAGGVRAIAGQRSSRVGSSSASPGARAGVRAEPRADGRAARCARQEAARADADRDQAAARAARADGRLRHARPERSADDVRPHRGVP